MKKSIIYLVAVIIILSFTNYKKQRVIFLGDSITQMGVNAGGYITRIDSLCTEDGFSNSFEFIGAGIGGNKIYDLFLRLEDDVLVKNPDVVIVYIGVNDVWHKSMFGTGTDADKFEKFYQIIIDKVKAKNCKVILCTPAVIGEKTDFSNSQDGDLNAFSNIIRNLSKKNNLSLVDLRKIFLEYNLKHNTNNKSKGILTTDGVHLNDKGNQLVADEIWKVLRGA